MSDQLFTDDAPFTDDPSPGPAPEVLGRSEIEWWADCCAKGWHLSNGRVSTSSMPADSGNEVHRILAEAVKARSVGGALPAELREMIDASAAQSRPDVQPDVIESLRKTWPIIQIICAHDDNGEMRNPEGLLKYDGGDGEHAGQIAALLEVDGVTVNLTCELDLLMASRSPKALDLHDWKSGHKEHTASSVKCGFQFPFYSYVAMRVYTTVDTINVSVFMPRKGYGTDPVDFQRRDMFATEQRIKSAIRLRRQYMSLASVDSVPAWAAPEKCRICPALQICHAAHEPIASEARDPEKMIRRLTVLDAQADDLRKSLAEMVRERGEDFMFAGVAYGQNAPSERKPRAKSCKVYEPDPLTIAAPGAIEAPAAEQKEAQQFTQSEPIPAPKRKKWKPAEAKV